MSAQATINIYIWWPWNAPITNRLEHAVRSAVLSARPAAINTINHGDAPPLGIVVCIEDFTKIPGDRKVRSGKAVSMLNSIFALGHMFPTEDKVKISFDSTQFARFLPMVIETSGGQMYINDLNKVPAGHPFQVVEKKFGGPNEGFLNSRPVTKKRKDKGRSRQR